MNQNPNHPNNPETDWIFGRRAVLTAIENGIAIERIFIAKDTQGETLHDIRTLSNQHSIRLDEVPKAAIDRYSRGIIHQGVAARIAQVKPILFDSWIQTVDKHQPYTLLYLDGITDTGNFGAIVRTASFFSAIVLFGEQHPPLSSATVRASSGTLLHTTLVQCPHPKQILQPLRDRGFWIYATSEHSEQSLFDVELPNRIVWVIGSEGEGVSDYYKKNADQSVSIPSAGHFHSLNASVAVGIFLFATQSTRVIHE